MSRTGHRSKTAHKIEIFNNIKILFCFRIQAAQENNNSKWSLYQSIILIAFVLICVAPLIVFLTVKTTISGEVSSLEYDFQFSKLEFRYFL